MVALGEPQAPGHNAGRVVVVVPDTAAAHAVLPAALAAAQRRRVGGRVTALADRTAENAAEPGMGTIVMVHALPFPDVDVRRLPSEDSRVPGTPARSSPPVLYASEVANRVRKLHAAQTVNVLYTRQAPAAAARPGRPDLRL